jgi:hypothetical protein
MKQAPAQLQTPASKPTETIKLYRSIAAHTRLPDPQLSLYAASTYSSITEWTRLIYTSFLQTLIHTKLPSLSSGFLSLAEAPFIETNHSYRYR